MTIRVLASSTAMALCMALSSAAPMLAQEGNRPFPCVAPTGKVAENPRALSQELMVMITKPGASGANGQTASNEVQLCSAGALQRAVDRGGDGLQAAITGAPDTVKSELVALGALADAGGDRQVPPPETETRKAEQQQPDVETVETSQQPEKPEKPEKPASPQKPASQSAGADKAAEPAGGKDKKDKAAGRADAPTDKDAPPRQAKDATTASEPKAAVGEAGQQQLTDAQRQRRAQARAERREAAAAVRAARREEAEGSTGADAQADNTQAAVETRTVTDAEVRRAEEDFDTAVTADVQADSGDKDRLSTFEKALLLGLGTAVVGTILNNGDEVVSNSGDRVVVERDGELRVLKNDDELLARPGAQVQSQTFQDGSTRETISYENGRQVITLRGADGTVLRRSVIRAEDGAEVVLFDDTQQADPIDFDQLPEPQTAAARQFAPDPGDQQALERALQTAIADDVDRRFSLQQVRDYKQVRALAPQVDVDAVTFPTGSAAIQPSQAEALSTLGLSLRDIIAREPGAVFLIEGHTDAVGSAGTNLALSDRRAETVALALTQYFEVPPQNLITQGYGETDLRVPTLTDERANRRAAVRNITGLLY